MDESIIWVVFAILFVAIMAVDLVVVGRKHEKMDTKRALKFVEIYVLIAVLFGLLIAYVCGTDRAMSYYAAYIIEMSMSVDNLFVFIVIFGVFMIPEEYQHKTLYWGILGAIVFRALFIFVGASLLEHFHFVMYIFGAILLFTAYKTAFSDDDDSDPEDSFAFKVSKHFPSTPTLHGDSFFTRIDGKRLVTPIFLCLVVIEISDIIFAFDSIPAALSISSDMVVIFTANIFAVMGLRSLYFVIKDIIGSLRYLNYGLGAILAFIGVKMLISEFFEISVVESLLFIVIVLLLTVFFSVRASKKEALP